MIERGCYYFPYQFCLIKIQENEKRKSYKTTETEDDYKMPSPMTFQITVIPKNIQGKINFKLLVTFAPLCKKCSPT